MTYRNHNREVKLKILCPHERGAYNRYILLKNKKLCEMCISTKKQKICPGNTVRENTLICLSNKLSRSYE